MKNAQWFWLALILFFIPLAAAQQVMITSSNQPRIFINFTAERDPVTITEARLHYPDGSQVDVKNRINMEWFNFFLLSCPILPNGNYTLRIMAEDDIGNPMTSYASFRFIVDTTKADVRIYTQPNTSVITTASYWVFVRFIQRPTTFTVTHIGPERRRVLNMTKVDDLTYKVQLQAVDGQQSIEVEAFAPNRPPMTGTYAYLVNAYPPEVELFRPRFGLVSAQPFDLIFKTDQLASCRYSRNIALSNYGSMTPLELINSTDGKNALYHKAAGFSGIPAGGNVSVFVRCNDSYGRIMDTSRRFVIGYDTTKPRINVSFDPRILYMYPLQATLVVTSDDATICRYDFLPQYNTFDRMRYTFPGFDAENYTKAHFKQLVFNSTTQSYTYYVACQNPVGLVSDVKSVTMEVNLNLQLTITDETLRWSNRSPILLKVVVNRRDAECFWSEDRNNINNRMSPLNDLRFTSSVSKSSDGDYTFYVKCFSSVNTPSATIRAGLDTVPPTAPIVNDSTTLSDKNKTWRRDQLTASWIATDNLSGIAGYRYALYDSNDNLIRDFTYTTERSATITGLNLTNGRTYYFRVYSYDRAGLRSERYGRSDGVKVDVSLRPAVCENGEYDPANETDLDCGKTCPRCGLGKKCINHTDCLTNLICVAPAASSQRVCVNSTCSDGIKGQLESDVDCGGPCSKCSQGKRCNKDEDCASGLACGTDGKCEVSIRAICSNGVFDVDYESDVDCGKRCAVNYGKKCSGGKRCTTNNDCESNNCLSTFVCAGGAASGDLDSDGVPDTSDNCKDKPNPNQEDMDKDGEGDACDTDIDGDRIPNTVEERYGLNPKDPSDRDKDYDSDGLSNYDELVVHAQHNLDPRKKDTDGDGWSDWDEIKKGTNPSDPSSRPRFLKDYWFPMRFGDWLWILIILIVLCALVLLAYYLSKPRKKKPEEKKPAPMAPPITKPEQKGPAAPVMQFRPVQQVPPRQETKPIPKPIAKPDDRDAEMKRMKERIMREFEVKKEQEPEKPKQEAVPKKEDLLLGVPVEEPKQEPLEAPKEPTKKELPPSPPQTIQKKQTAKRPTQAKPKRVAGVYIPLSSLLKPSEVVPSKATKPKTERQAPSAKPQPKPVQKSSPKPVSSAKSKPSLVKPVAKKAGEKPAGTKPAAPPHMDKDVSIRTGKQGATVVLTPAKPRPVVTQRTAPKPAPKPAVKKPAEKTAPAKAPQSKSPEASKPHAASNITVKTGKGEHDVAVSVTISSKKPKRK